MSGHVRRTRCGIAVEEQEAASAGTARNGRDLARGEDGRKRCRDISAGEAGENGCESIHAVAGLDQHRIPVGEARQGEAAGDPTGAVEESGQPDGALIVEDDGVAAWLAAAASNDSQIDPRDQCPAA